MLPAMSSAGADTPSADPPPQPAPPPDDPALVGALEAALPKGCPFLLAETGGWRLDLPSRDHRCSAFSPPAPLSPEKQARLCLTAAHATCATYLASHAARESRLGAAPVERATRWGLARTTTVIEDPGGVRAWLSGALLDRRRWPAIPAVLLVTTLFTLAISGFRANNPATVVATGSPPAPTRTPAATARPTAAPSPAPVATEAPSLEPSTAPTVAPTAPPTAAPSVGPAASFRIYVVQSGDTLSAIASRFGTTVQAIVNLNNLSDPGRLSIGQVLKIPS